MATNITSVDLTSKGWYSSFWTEYKLLIIIAGLLIAYIGYTYWKASQNKKKQRQQYKDYARGEADRYRANLMGQQGDIYSDNLYDQVEALNRKLQQLEQYSQQLAQQRKEVENYYVDQTEQLKREQEQIAIQYKNYHQQLETTKQLIRDQERLDGQNNQQGRGR